MKKLLSLSLALALGLSLLTGCSDASSSQAETSAAPSSVSASNKTGSSEPAPEPAAPAPSVPADRSAASSEAESSSEAAPASSGEPASSESDAGSSGAVRVMALKGPTAMGMVQLMQENGETGLYDFTIAAAIDEVTPKIVQGEVDIAAVPANLAAVLYNNTQGKIQVIGINTLGVLYVVEAGETVQTAADLKDRTIYASGKGATPEYALNYILEQNGLTPGKDVTIEWKSEHAECVAALTSDEDGIAMLPQPFVATAQAKNPDIRIALDLTEEWDAVQKDEPNPSSLLTGVVIARTEFIENRPEELDDFLNGYGDSVKFVNENMEEAAELIGEYNIVPAAVAVKALPYCNIVLIESTDMKEKLSGYLSVLFEQNPKSVGGQLPGDAFYYGA